MKLRIGDVHLAGDAIDLRARDDVRAGPETLQAALTAGSIGAVQGSEDRPTTQSGDRVVVEDISYSSPEKSLVRVPSPRSVREQLAAAARSRGYQSSFDDRIAEIESTLADLSVPTVDLEEARRRVARSASSTRVQRERVVTTRETLASDRDTSVANHELESEIRSMTAELARRETETVAARQALSEARQRAREARDVRERRLRLEDRLRNRNREAIDELTAAIYPDFREAVSAVGGDVDSVGTAIESFEGDPVTASLAAVRLSAQKSPVVLGLETVRFEDARRAHERLGVPVVRTEP